ncbi:MAG: peptide chain release factor N(5)-glutamine methyltransferase [Firmicutes bacterium]|nr:peptide chain release factor N(5)-glutamine methyltransferase [Bacillota bacterium]
MIEWRQAFQEAVRELQESGIEEGSREAGYLLSWATGKSLAEWWMQGGVIPSPQYARFREGVRRRQHHEPIAYIVGRREFYGLDLVVTPAVLIPRPETELLVERILAEVRLDAACVADIGTGSGAIALALKHERPEWRVIGADVDSQALAVARENGRRLGLEVLWVESHLLERVPRPLDAIVANLPYVDAEDGNLSRDLFFEPRQALFAPDKGQALIRQLIERSGAWLKPEGLLMVECGDGQSRDLAEWMREHGYVDISAAKDLAGIDRVLSGRWPGKGVGHGGIH